MGIDEWIAVKATLGPNFDGTQSSALRGVIVQVNCMSHGQRPHAAISFIRPSQGGVKHHDAGAPRDVFDAIFGNSIVMVTSHATVPDGLARFSQGTLEMLGGVNAIVCAVSLDVDPNGRSVALEREFGLHCFMRGESDLVFQEHEPGGGVTEDCAAHEFLVTESLSLLVELLTQQC